MVVTAPPTHRHPPSPEEKPPPLGEPSLRVESKGNVRAGRLWIFIWQATLLEIIKHSKSDLRREVGGILLGGYYTCDGQGYVEINAFLPARYGVGDAGSFRFTHDAWSDIHHRLDEEYPDKQIVGWQHTHPAMEVFLSDRDLFIHRHFFDQPWHVALVVDPVRNRLQFFQWRGERIVDCGFYLVR